MIGAILPLALALAQAGPPERMIYTCPTHEETIAGVGKVTMFKTFNPDGTIYLMRVSAQIDTSPLLGLSDPRDWASVSLEWPGDYYTYADGNERPFDWSNGVIAIRYDAFGVPKGLRAGPEKWQQTIIDRGGGAVAVETRDGKRWLRTSPLTMYVASDPNNSYWPNAFHMAIDNLLAWGSGVDHVTIYSVAVSRAKDLRTDKRIFASYTLDPRVLATIVAKVRTAVVAWEANVADYKTACRFEPESARYVIVT